MVAYNSEGDGPGSNIAGPYITPEDTPDKPTSVTFQDAEMGLVNMSWTDPVKTNGIVIGYSVKYKELPGNKVQNLEVKGQQRWTIVDKLKPAALYEFSVAAKTKAGIGRYKKENFDFTWRMSLIFMTYFCFFRTLAIRIFHNSNFQLFELS